MLIPSMELLKNLAMLASSTNRRTGNWYLDGLNSYPAWLGGDPYYRFLMLISEYAQPLATLELGVYMGLGSGYMSHGCKHSRCIGIDRSLHPKAWDTYNVFHPRIYWVEGDTIQCRPIVENVLKGDKIGILFIDAEHTAERAAQELSTYKPLLAPGCVICFDDVAAPAMDGLDHMAGIDIERMDYLHTYNNAGFGVAIWTPR